MMTSGSDREMVRVVLEVRVGGGSPLEGTISTEASGERRFHGWLELMGLLEEARTGPER